MPREHPRATGCRAGTVFDGHPCRCELRSLHLGTHVAIVPIDGRVWYVYWGGPLPDGIVPDRVVAPVDDDPGIPQADIEEAARLRDATDHPARQGPTHQIAQPSPEHATDDPPLIDPERKNVASEPPPPPPARRRTKGRIY